MESRLRRRRVREETWKQLSLIRTALLDDSSMIHLCHDDLTALGIKQSAMDLTSDNEHDSGPRFCTPFASDAIATVIDTAFGPWSESDVEYTALGTYNLEYWGAYHSAAQVGNMMLRYMGNRAFDPNMFALTATKWDPAGVSTGCFPFFGHHYFECTDSTDYFEWVSKQWSVIEVLGIPNHHQPHIACVLIDGASADGDRLRRSELYCIVEYMMRSMKLDELDQFMVNPVFVYSISVRHARILEAHFDGSHLVVRTSQYLNFEEKNEENLKLYLRWMLSQPTGPTNFPAVEDCREAASDSLRAACSTSKSLKVPIISTAVVV
ncbi:hypothetical protein MMC07_000855 [Pseudocyphellaria aurata]|nr:hypothetical protein [Pseudocyphellaria aurata]